MPSHAILLTSWPEEPSSLLLLESARRQGHVLRLVTPWQPPPAGDVRGRPLLARIGQRSRQETLQLLRHLENAGAQPLNPSVAIARAKDKASLVDLLAPRPRCALLVPPRGLPFRYPVVVKARHGARGDGVRLLDGPADWELLPPSTAFVVEEFLPPDQRREWRVLVCCGRPIAAVERFPPVGDFRCGTRRGGRSRPVPAPEDVVRAAVAATAELGLGLAGVDVARIDRPCVLDVNDSPGLGDISRTSQRDLAAELLNCWLSAP